MEASAHDILGIGVTLLLAVAFGWAARRAGLPAVVGYLAAGVMVSPFTPGFVANRSQLVLLANVGVVLLLFEVGIEIDPVKLGAERSSLIGIALAQTILTVAVALVAAAIFGMDIGGAALVAVAVALSSSIVVVNITRSRKRTTNEPTNEVLLAWSVVQDIAGVGIAIVVLALIGVSSRPVWVSLLSFVGFVIAAIATAWLFPRLLRHLHLERDLFLLFTVATALVIAGVGSQYFEVPIALAAFIAGLAVSEGPDTSAARRRLLPLREVFAVLFFVAIGSLIDPARIVDALPWATLLIAVLVFAKVVPIFVLLDRFALPGVNGLQVAIGLGQVGEFSFVLALIGVRAGLVPVSTYTAMLLLIVVSIAASTVLVRIPGRGAAPAA